MAEQEKAELSPTAEWRQAQEAAARTPEEQPKDYSPNPPLSPPWPPAKTGRASIGRTGVHLNTSPCSTCTLSFNPYPPSAAPAQEKHGCPLMIVGLACQICPQIDGQPTALSMKDPTCTKGLQLCAGWQDGREEASGFGKNSLLGSQRRMWWSYCLSFLGNSWA